MTTISSNPANVSPRRRAPLPLQPGDHLTRAEFERRWAAMPHLTKAELINGVVYMATALRADQHGIPHARIMAWLGGYVALTPGVEFGDNSSARLDEDNMPQPDASLWIKEEAGGQCPVDADGYLAGAPELIVEVAASSASYDLHDKLAVYRRHSVREYVVWRVLDEAIDWFALEEGRFDPLAPGDDGVFRSRVFPGLCLDAAAMLRGDLAKVFDVVRSACESDEHKAFVARLAQALKDRAPE